MASSTKQSRASRFQRGSGAFICRICQHNTRDTGGDGAGVQLCDICCALSGEENSLSDSGDFYESHAFVRELLARLDTRSGNGTAARCFPTVFAHAA